jgi:ferrochelatase
VAALREALGDETPVYVGMRCWRPTIADAVNRAADDGVTDLLAVPMAPQYSTFIVEGYVAEVEGAAGSRLRARFVESWHDHPLLIQAFAEKIRESRDEAQSRITMFSAHSLPERVIRGGDPYVQRVRATVRGVSSEIGMLEHEIAFQSAGRTPEPWLGPTVEERLEALARENVRSVLVVPVSFLCDHAEILYDIDVQAREKAAQLDIALRRTASLNVSNTLIRALADLVSIHA